jgi:hypothetical protein
VSLWRLLRAQHGTLAPWMTHEAKPLLPWAVPSNTSVASEAATRLALLARRRDSTDLHGEAARARQPSAPRDGRTFVGDVASSYLPYVEALLDASPCVVAIILQRPREEVVRSWLAKTGDADFWRRGNRSEAERETIMAEVDESGNATAAAKAARAEAYWGGLFPKYSVREAPRKEDAIRLYWEEYARRAAALAARHPARARVFPSPDVFARGDTQHSLLAFAGFAAPRLRPARRYNCAASCPPKARSPGELAAEIMAKRAAGLGGGFAAQTVELWRKPPPRKGPPGPLPMQPQWPG